MSPDDIETLFTRPDGSYAFARWARPLAPIVFGVEDTTLGVVRSACETVAQIAGHEIVEMDPELGSNLMVFFMRDWAELLEVPDLDKLLPDLASLVARLSAAKATQYRVFRFEKTGAIRACYVLLRMDSEMARIPADALALSQMAQVILMWSQQAFASTSPLAVSPEGLPILRPDIAQVIRAAYDPVLPDAADQSSHALRLAARAGVSR